MRVNGRRFLVVGDTWSNGYGDAFITALRARGAVVMIAEVSAGIARQPIAFREPFRTLNRAQARLLRPVRRIRFGLHLDRLLAHAERGLVSLIVGMVPIPAATLERMKRLGPVVVFMNDDIETAHGRPESWWAHARPLLGAAQLLVTQRPHRVAAIRRHFGGEVLFQDFAYNERLHYVIRAEKDVDVAFLGSGDPDRVPFFRALVERRLDVAIWGPDWNAKEIGARRRTLRGYLPPERVAAALARSSIGLCLVRHLNFDYQVMRTFEVPACGVFLLAERTPDHQRLFREGIEADLFGSLEELADKATFYVRHVAERERIARAGWKRIVEAPNTIQDRLADVLSHPVLA